jgi:hypothetical protein
MRKTKTFDGDGILLDVWEGKFHRWLDILEKGGSDNKQMVCIYYIKNFVFDLLTYIY